METSGRFAMPVGIWIQVTAATCVALSGIANERAAVKFMTDRSNTDYPAASPQKFRKNAMS